MNTIKVNLNDNIYTFNNFETYIAFYRENIHKTEHEFTKFTASNKDKSNDVFTIKTDNGDDVTIEGATQALSSLIKHSVKNSSAVVQDKTEGWNPGCKYTIGEKVYFSKVLSGDIDGKYSWANEIFIYKLIHKLGYGPKCSFNSIEGAEPLTMITTEDVFQNQTPGSFPISNSSLPPSSKSEQQDAAVLDFLFNILLIDDIFYKYHNVGNINNKAMVYDILASPHDDDYNSTTKNDWNSQKKIFDSFRNEYSSSGSLVGEDNRELIVYVCNT